jgi:glyoxylase-like metal-dependent hydrolase (beta-lactamase superfamily II)
VGPARTLLAPGVWITCGRAAVLEGADHLAVIDPGDEPGGTVERPAGPLRDVLDLVRQTGKPLRWILLTHAHPDHVENLDLFRGAGPARVVAHARSPVGPDTPVTGEVRLPLGNGIEAIPTPGHSAWGDDLTFWAPGANLVFTGDVVQPKGETWEETFYPSPWVYFSDGDVYLESLGRIARLPFTTLVTGHREVRRGEAARLWVELTARSIREVAEAVRRWAGPDDLSAAGPSLYRALARDRGIPDEAIDARLAGAPGKPSAFDRFDLPGLAFYWRRFGRSTPPAP